MSISVNNVSKFRFIAHKVMPLVFDESLSYYEFLCKVLQKMNEVIENEDDQNQVLVEFDAEMTRFEGEMNSKYTEFASQVDAAIAAFEASETAAREAFETSITNQQNTFENEITNQQNTFETNINADFTEFLENYQRQFGIAQSTGDSTTDAMSQKAITDEIKILNETDGDLCNPGFLYWTKGTITSTGAIYTTGNGSSSGLIYARNLIRAVSDRPARIYCFSLNRTYLGSIKEDFSLTTPAANTNKYIGVLPIKKILTTYPNVYWFRFDTLANENEVVTDWAEFGENHLELNVKYDDIIYKEIDNARTITNSTNGVPLTLLQISDIHRNKAALARINKKIKPFLLRIDDKICTGDMVLNSAEEIESWWDSSYMTIIGNHDTRVGSNWTGLSVTDRIANYISPFESNWGITRPDGCSYYYKDYANQKVRLICLDAMLYVAGGSDATDQNTWLSGLLDNAIANNLHVLIATHSPANGATAIDCSFSKYGATTCTVADNVCTLPESLITLVSQKITNGCKFIGYIVGHVHQDGIWKATDDGKQLIYCVTCATYDMAADQCREINYVSTYPNFTRPFQYSEGAYYDAANLITIDTAHTLVKIIRIGGADMDLNMRTRKAICFNYSTGTLIGEIK